MKQKNNNGKHKKKKSKNGNLTKETLDTMKESQENQLGTNKAIADLSGADNDEEENKKFRILITVSRSKKYKETNEKITEKIQQLSES